MREYKSLVTVYIEAVEHNLETNEIMWRKPPYLIKENNKYQRWNLRNTRENEQIQKKERLEYYQNKFKKTRNSV